MKIFFGEANPEQYENLEPQSLFRDPETLQHYFYMITTDEDGCIRIHDTCNRMVPFDISQTEALCEAVYAMQEILNVRASVEERTLEDIDQIIECTHQYTGVRILA
jgi:hypothetical protein